MLYTIWKDGHKSEAIKIEADDMPTALDMAAFRFGHINYAAMAEFENWTECNDGLNIEEDFNNQIVVSCKEKT